MKKVILTATLSILVSIVSAQSPLEERKMQLNGGFGFSDWGVPLYGGLDYAIHRDITIGGEISYRSYKNNFSNINYKHSIVGISANGNYHFNTLLKIPKPWDLYGGINVGYYIWNSSNNYPGTESSNLGLNLLIGGRYYFNNDFAINLEIAPGNNFTGGKIGITYKL